MLPQGLNVPLAFHHGFALLPPRTKESRPHVTHVLA